MPSRCNLYEDARSVTWREINKSIKIKDVENPSKRLTVKGALYHAFFSKFPKPDRIETVGLNLEPIAEELGARLNAQLMLFDGNDCP
ncbi:unnamed protein product [Hymenolepis diminuta]|uniref:DNA primase n=1 Tax=Hymenolepis diminuta TaxID=6216 RepID=A0A0R3SPP1_HYMDI|nr:unnamed protein product [Hymenolepis diminuta]